MDIEFRFWRDFSFDFLGDFAIIFLYFDQSIMQHVIEHLSLFLFCKFFIWLFLVTFNRLEIALVMYSIIFRERKGFFLKVTIILYGNLCFIF